MSQVKQAKREQRCGGLGALGAALVVALAGGVGGCSADADAPLADVPGSEWPSEPGEGACEEGAVRDCEVSLGEHGGVVSCFVGQQTCRGGRWSDCLGRDGAQPAAPGGLRPLSLGPSEECGDSNPCDPGCRTFEEVPDVPYEPDTGDPVIDWTQGDLEYVLNGFPSGLTDKGFMQPCLLGSHCQFNMHCDNVATGPTCSHSKCVRGQGLDSTCDACVALICASRPSCCDATASGIPGLSAESIESSHYDEISTFDAEAVRDPVDGILDASPCSLAQRTRLCSFSVYGTSSVRLGDRTQTNGYVGSSAPATSSLLTGQNSRYAGIQVTSNVINQSNITGNVLAGGTYSSQNGGTVAGLVCDKQTVTPMAVTTEALPAPACTGTSYTPNTPTSGCQDVELPPGNYGAVEIRRATRLLLSAGTYTFSSLKFHDGGGGDCTQHATLRLDVSAGQKIDVKVCGDVYFGNFMVEEFADGSNDPTRVSFYSNTVNTVRLPTDMAFYGTVTAPSAEIHVYSRTPVQGALWGRSIYLEPDISIDSSKIVAACKGCSVANDCLDGSLCTVDTCVNAMCQYAPRSCSDGTACTRDSCSPATGCANVPISCSDGNACTSHSCDAVTGCTYAPVDCDDGSACTSDSCNTGFGCVNAPVSCNDGNLCTVDGCDAASGCRNTPKNCNDGNACTSDTCNPSNGNCASVAISCDDGDACTLDSCDTSIGCAHVTRSCNDGDACTLDACDPATGCSNTRAGCDDGDPCTTDSCDPASGCVNTLVTCGDSDPCTRDSCDGASGDCLHATIPDCDPDNPCTFTDCSDGSACTTDSCTLATGCSATPIDCDDLDPCTVESCDPVAGCQRTALGCDDANACTADSCSSASGCVNEPLSCDDDDACTVDACDPASGCSHAAVSCDDGDACTTDSCDATSGCQHTAVSCDDGSACTADSCDPLSGCVNSTITCNDADLCTTDGCDPATGCTTVPVSCDDDDACTTETCDPAGGCQYQAVTCGDGDACTTDSCDSATGCAHAAVTCNDSNGCTDDSCDPALGCVYTNNTAPCADDGSSCTDDRCRNGACAHRQNGSCGWNDTCVSMVETVCQANCSEVDVASCLHDVCTEGAALDSGCHPCAAKVCAASPTCCSASWGASCVNATASLCGGCPVNMEVPLEESGQCMAWYPLETDPTCDGFDLTLDVPCIGGVSVCNHGMQDAPTGITIALWPSESSDFAALNPDTTKIQSTCTTVEPIPAGRCRFTPCPFGGNNKTLMVNPPGTLSTAGECSTMDNWSLARKDAPECKTPFCMDEEIGSLDSTSCQFTVPTTILTDFRTANLTYIDMTTGDPATLTLVSGASACAASSWYYLDATRTVGVLCPDTCAALTRQMASTMNIEMACKDKALETSFTQTYTGTCGTGKRPVWGFLAWDTVTPTTTSVSFHVRTAAALDGLATASYVDVGVAQAAPLDNQVCVLGSLLSICPVSVYDALGDSAASMPALELKITLHPTADGIYAPVTNDWELTYSCVDSE